ncbi:unnamed protein product, partial [Phaeothamnion confervicola]
MSLGDNGARGADDSEKEEFESAARPLRTTGATLVVKRAEGGPTSATAGDEVSNKGRNSKEGAGGGSSSGGGVRGRWGDEPWQNFELIKSNIRAVSRLRRKGVTPPRNTSPVRKGDISDYDSDDEMAQCQCRPDSPGGRTCHDNSCINYATNTECPKGHCNPGCCNQNLQLRRYAKLEVAHTGSAAKGHGLRLLEPVREGAFLIEYVGEIIDAEELDRRMQSDGQGASRLYMMQLAHNQYLDAKRRGGIARFINHSCEPACRLERWRAGPHLCCAVFADRDMAAGEELSFDYQWSTHKGRKKTKCLCAAATCRGTLEVDELDNDNDPLGLGAGLGLGSMGYFRMPRAEDVAEPTQLQGRRVRIYWDGDYRYYAATVGEYNPETGKHVVLYDGEDDAEGEEVLGLDGGGGGDDDGGGDDGGDGGGGGVAKWQIWEESETAVVIARREKTSESGTTDVETDSDEGRRDRESQEERSRRLAAVTQRREHRPPPPPPPPFVPPRIMESYFVASTEVPKLVGARGGAIMAVQ